LLFEGVVDLFLALLEQGGHVFLRNGGVGGVDYKFGDDFSDVFLAKEHCCDIQVLA